jgi:hypothetical protein
MRIVVCDVVQIRIAGVHSPLEMNSRLDRQGSGG